MKWATTIGQNDDSSDDNSVNDTSSNYLTYILKILSICVLNSLEKIYTPPLSDLPFHAMSIDEMSCDS